MHSEHKREDQAERAKLVGAWLKASPDKKDAARKAALDGGVKADELTKALAKQRSEAKREVHHVVTTKRSKSDAEEMSKIYNLRE